MRKKLQAWGSLPAVLFSLFLFIYCPSFSQGGPDPAFGNAGIVTTNIGFGATSEVVNAIALQPDGKIVAVGYVMPFANSSQRFFNVARYNPDGTLDAGFGTGGLVRTDFGTEQFPTDGHATDVEILDDGSILVVGHVTGNPDNTRKIALALYQPNGALQTSFGSGGKLFVGENLVGYSTDAFLTMQGNKIIVGASVPASHTRLFRLNAGGTTDISFGNAGEAVVEPLPGESISINDIAVQPDNKILLAGTRGSGLSSEFVLYKRSIDGQAEGRITADLGPDYNITNSIALQPDGKIVVVGYAGNDVAVARYNSDGSLDNSFDSDGKLLTSFGSSHARAIGNEVVLQPDGKIVVVGSLFPLANPGSPYLGAAIRYESNGQLDPCFGDDGKLVIDLPAGMDDLTSIAIQTDGKIVFGGHSSSISSGFDIVLARYIFPQAVTWYRDADLDGYGDDNNNIVSCTDPSTQEISCPQIIDPSCTLPIELCPLINDPNCTPSPAVKYVTTGGDCDDNNPEINPGAPEVCDGFDNNCNGETDEGINLQTWYLDYDGDGYGNDNTAVTTCVQPLSQVVKVDPFCIDLPPFFTCPTKIIHWVTTGGDCADAWPTTHPGATEVCDGFDNDCDGQIDEGLPTTTYYTDADGDGYGSGVGEAFCSNPGAGWASQAGDCDDSNASIHPVMGGDGKELCDGIDNDCDGLIDEGCSGKPTISISNATVYESEGLARVTIRLSHITTLQVKVNYKTEDGTAMSTKKDKDYKAIGNTTLTIPPGTLTITITVPVYNDGIVENNEYFYVVLSKPVNGILGNATGMVTILDGGEANITAKSSAGVSAQPSLEIESLDVTAFPNPSRDNFKIKITSPDQKERVLLKVYDVSGRLIETRTSISPNSIIQFGDKYRAGVYMIQVVQGEQHKELKLVKLN